MIVESLFKIQITFYQNPLNVITTPMKAFGLTRILFFVGILFLISCQKNLYRVAINNNVIQLMEPNYKISFKYFGDYKFFTKIKDKFSKKEFKNISNLINNEHHGVRIKFIYQAKTTIEPYYTHYLLKLNANFQFPLNKIFKPRNIQNGLAFAFRHSNSFFLLIQLHSSEDMSNGRLETANAEFKNITETLQIITPN